MKRNAKRIMVVQKMWKWVSKLCRKCMRFSILTFLVGKCMENVGVEAGDSRDNMGRYRFFALAPEFFLRPGVVIKKS